MSGILRPTGVHRAVLAGVAALVLLTGCGRDGGQSTTGTPDGTPVAAADSSTTSARADGADFCRSAAGIDDRVDSALTDRRDDDPSVADAFRQIATELRGIPAPAAITSDWGAMAAGLDRMADAFGGLDVTDLDSLEALDRAEGDLTAASRRVETYLSDECGL
jgi:hypothetical protein